MSISNRLDGRTAVVTGAASGIGRAIARRLLDEGATVVRVDRDEKVLEHGRVQAELRTVDAVADLGQAEEIDRLCTFLGEAVPAVDILVNAAGIVRSTPVATMDVNEWNEVLAVNLTGPFLLARALAPAIADAARSSEATGSIVNITSIEAHVVVASSGETQPHYAASKGGLHMLTRALAVELAPTVRVNAIAPGLIETPLTAGIRADDARLGYYLDRTPLRRLGRPEDIAAAAAYLSSEDSSFVTGSTLFVDGGWTAL